LGLIQELRSRARHIIGPVIGISYVVYFGYHVLHGDRGLIALRQLTQTVESAKKIHEGISEKRMALGKRVRLLYPGSLDPDMLEERARVMLNYGYADDIVVMFDGNGDISKSSTQAVSFTSQN
jgi:cell division protein FtsB